MTRNRIYLLVVVLVAIGIFWGYLYYTERPPEVVENVLVCKVCGKQLPQKDAKCPWCESKKVREEIEAKARGEEVPQSGTGSNTTKVIVGVGASIVLLGIAVWPWVGKRLRLSKEDEAYLEFRCEKCKRKLRYLASKSGMLGMCPTCKRPCKFP